MSKKKGRNRQLKNVKIDQQIEVDRDENFAFIAGYTSGGAPYGLTHEEMTELEMENKEQEKPPLVHGCNPTDSYAQGGTPRKR